MKQVVIIMVTILISLAMQLVYKERITPKQTQPQCDYTKCREAAGIFAVATYILDKAERDGTGITPDSVPAYEKAQYNYYKECFNSN